MLVKRAGVAPEVRDAVDLRDKALAGDMVFVLSPATCTQKARSTAWTRTVIIELQSAAGELHDWFSKAITTGVSIADTSTAGTATIASTTLTFTNGRASVEISGDAAAWVADDTDTLTVAQATILGYTIAAKTSVQTWTA